jgi:hypothetical protein
MFKTESYGRNVCVAKCWQSASSPVLPGFGDIGVLSVRSIDSLNRRSKIQSCGPIGSGPTVP